MAGEIVGEIGTEFERMSVNAQRAEVYAEKKIRDLLNSCLTEGCDALITRMPNQWQEDWFKITQGFLGTHEYFERERERINNLKTLLGHICEKFDYQDLFTFYRTSRKYGIKHAFNKYKEKSDKIFGRAIIHVDTVKSEKEVHIIGLPVDEKEIHIIGLPVDEKEDTKNKENRKEHKY